MSKVKMKTKLNFLLLLTSLLFLQSCTAPTSNQGDPNDPDIPETEAGTDIAYPIRDINDSPQSSYPITESEPMYPQGPVFSINEPLRGGENTVTGTGPANVPIILVDVSEIGLTLGETIIESNGTFTFTLSKPLLTGHIIGIKLGNIEGTDLSENDFMYSETYYERPYVGILFDLVVVE